MMSLDKPLTLAELLARLDHPGRSVNEARSDGEDVTNTDGTFWICESQPPGLSHIVETVTLDDDALSGRRRRSVWSGWQQESGSTRRWRSGSRPWRGFAG